VHCTNIWLDLKRTTTRRTRCTGKPWVRTKNRPQVWPVLWKSL